MAVPEEITPETAVSRAAWEEALDPSLRDAAYEYLRSLVAYPRAFNSHADERIRAALQRRIAQFPHLATSFPSESYSSRRMVSYSITWIMTLSLIAFFFVFRIDGLLPAFMTLLVGSTVAAVVYLRQVARVTNAPVVQEKQGEVLFRSFLPQALEQVAKKPSERAYADAVLDLLPGETNGYLSDEWRTEQMSSMAALLDSSRQIETIRQQIAVVLTDTSPETLQEEIEALRSRFETMEDEVTKNTLAQSITLCEERLERNKSLAVIVQRLDAESELIYHTFGATRSMLTSLRLSPSTAVNGTGSSRSVEVAETIARQTRSVEAAIQELGIQTK